ncbi:hypothetical protein V6R21_02935 [Limibacter armeniacum]|uniref:hypothetical protein n=1 Tax=Limibacter armeniacum TaxID=466084 RepID=UPI002FE5BA36
MHKINLNNNKWIFIIIFLIAIPITRECYLNDNRSAAIDMYRTSLNENINYFDNSMDIILNATLPQSSNVLHIHRMGRNNIALSGLNEGVKDVSTFISQEHERELFDFMFNKSGPINMKKISIYINKKDTLVSYSYSNKLGSLTRLKSENIKVNKNGIELSKTLNVDILIHLKDDWFYYENFK